MSGGIGRSCLVGKGDAYVSVSGAQGNLFSFDNFEKLNEMLGSKEKPAGKKELRSLSKSDGSSQRAIKLQRVMMNGIDTSVKVPRWLEDLDGKQFIEIAMGNAMSLPSNIQPAQMKVLKLQFLANHTHNFWRLTTALRVRVGVKGSPGDKPRCVGSALTPCG